jgi:hypothetical protein
MARAFATNQQINGTTTVAQNLTNFSMAGWIRRASSGSLQAWGPNDNSFLHQSLLWHFTDNIIYFIIRNGDVNSYGTSSQNITGWNHIAMTFDGSQGTNAGKLKGYLNGSPLTLTFAGTIPATTSNDASHQIFRIGRVVGGNFWSTGDFAELGMWQATLTAAEIASLAKGITCDKVRPQSLVYYTPLIRDIQDLARGMTLTDTNTTVATHPRVYA